MFIAGGAADDKELEAGFLQAGRGGGSSGVTWRGGRSHHLVLDPGILGEAPEESDPLLVCLDVCYWAELWYSGPVSPYRGENKK